MTVLRFHKHYFILTLLLLLTEVVIALYVQDNFVRPYVGDFLVVILLYCFFKTFLTISNMVIAVVVLGLAYLIEISQYFHLANHLGLQNNSVLRVILGSSFEWSDVLAYTLGIILVLYLEKMLNHIDVYGGK